MFFLYVSGYLLYFIIKTDSLLAGKQATQVRNDPILRRQNTPLKTWDYGVQRSVKKHGILQGSISMKHLKKISILLI